MKLSSSTTKFIDKSHRYHNENYKTFIPFIHFSSPQTGQTIAVACLFVVGVFRPFLTFLLQFLHQFRHHSIVFSFSYTPTFLSFYPCTNRMEIFLCHHRNTRGETGGGASDGEKKTKARQLRDKCSCN
jgi:hypothetical protein